MKINNYLSFSLFLLLFGCNSPTPTSATDKLDFSEIRTLLDSIYVEDQKYRNEIGKVREEFGRDSREWAILTADIRITDKSNLEVVEKILDEHGWLGADEIGATANTTLFLVIQHSNLKTQEKYLSMMEKAVKDGKARGTSMALLVDRVNLGKGELQIYGSQLGPDPDTGEPYVLPVIEPEKINERRASVGLQPIEEYITRWNIEWDIESYKKELPRRIQIMKETKILK